MAAKALYLAENGPVGLGGRKKVLSVMIFRFFALAVKKIAAKKCLGRQGNCGDEDGRQINCDEHGRVMATTRTAEYWRRRERQSNGRPPQTLNSVRFESRISCSSNADH